MAMTPKQIGKMIKAKGLQKLRWYCQMCQKQCRDANGFKCHTESESHQRQMLVFAGNSGKILDTFSIDFEKGMMDIIRTRYKNKRVHANVVYNEYIKDRHHIHMNSTRWSTLSGFCLHIGKSGKCKIEDTPKGWYLSYIERDPELLEKQQKAERKERMEIDEAKRNQKELEERVKKGVSNTNEDSKKPEELILDSNVKIGFSFGGKKAPVVETSSVQETSINEPKEEEEEIETIDYDGDVDYLAPDYAEKEAEDEETKEKPIKIETPEIAQKVESSEEKKVETFKEKNITEDLEVSENLSSGKPPIQLKPSVSRESSNSISSSNDKKRTRWDEDEKSASSKPPSTKEKETNKKVKRLSAMQEIMSAEEQKKDRMNRRDHWIEEGLVVKVINKHLADGKYYKQKGVVKKVFDKYVALLRMIDSGDVLKLDQSQLETVLPGIGQRILIINGAYREQSGSLIAVNVDKFTASIRMETGIQTGTVIEFDYEDICKSERVK